jgi:hypothetical protein
MNRRDAIKKLAAGGAVTLGASAVLSTNNVAFAASPPDTGLVGVPAQGAPPPLSFSPNGNGTVTLDASSGAACISGASPTITYAWKVNSFSFSGGNRHLILSSNGQTIHDTKGGSGYSAASTGYAVVNVAKTNNGSKRQIKPLASSDTYNLSLLITWQCSGANSALEAEYVISGVGPGSVSGSNASWNII